MSEWINVKEKLPPKQDKDWSVPVLYYYYDQQPWMYVGIYCFKDKNWYGDNAGSHSHTTHWMPLPNPPKVAE
jgi:hypothetical protein